MASIYSLSFCLVGNVFFHPHFWSIFFTEYKILGCYYVPPPSTLKMLFCFFWPPWEVGSHSYHCFFVHDVSSLSSFFFFFFSLLWLHSRFFLYVWFSSIWVWHASMWFYLCLSWFGLAVKKVKVLIAQLCPTIRNPVDCTLPGSSVRRIVKARILQWVSHSLLQGIFLTLRSNLDFLHCRQIMVWAIRNQLYLLKLVFSLIFGKFSAIYFSNISFPPISLSSPVRPQL